MKKVIAALFDLDGVVVDTETQYSRIWDELGKKYLAAPVEDFSIRIKGTSLKQILDRYFNPQDHAAIVAELDAQEDLLQFDFIPGVIQFVEELRNADVKVAIVTSSNQKQMSHLYQQHYGLKPMFDAIITADDITKSKPDPECYLLAAQRLGVAPEDCFVFEDSLAGLEAGRAANMHVVALATTYKASQLAGKADQIIDNFQVFGHKQMMNLYRTLSK